MVEGTVSNNNGEYSLRVPSGGGPYTVVFSYIGMKTQSIPYNGQSSLEVVLEEDTSKGMESLNVIEIYDETTSRVTYQSVKIVVADKGDKLTVRLLDSDKEIDVSGDYHYLPFVFEDGCVHFINGMF